MNVNGVMIMLNQTYTLIETDLSQAELRIAAWMAGEDNMINIYANDGDIHAATAAHIMGKSMDQFYDMSDELMGLKRFQAKAVFEVSYE